ncbi:hypothetical protein KP509_22G000800 [Ceratopteris richardii]|nr:hypothetical protein KP509_22G000800 [Ceratopteris richardii]
MDGATASAKPDLEGSNTVHTSYGSSSEHSRRPQNTTEYDTPLLLTKEIDRLKIFIKTRIVTEIEDIKLKVSSHFIHERNGSTEPTESSELRYSQTADNLGKGALVQATSIEAAGSQNHEETHITDHELNGGKSTDTKINTTEMIGSDMKKLVDRIQRHIRNLALKLTATRYGDEERYTTEARICQYMFDDFECASFGCYTEQLFQNPHDEKRKNINMYDTCKESEPKTLYKDRYEFKNFVERKESHLQSNISEFNQGSSDFRDALWTLSKDIWLLHILAFACEPRSAEIFRVPQGSQYVYDYMTLMGKKPSRNEKSVRKNRTVSFMTTPGFTLRNRIIRAYVRCSTIQYAD